jgi:hypothetical protein
VSLKSFFEEWDALASESCKPSVSEWRKGAVRQYTLLMNVEVHLKNVNDGIALELYLISSSPQGSGKGTDALSILCGTADRHGVMLVLTSNSAAPGESQRRLNNWYIRHGFKKAMEGRDDDVMYMEREPRCERKTL